MCSQGWEPLLHPLFWISSFFLHLSPASVLFRTLDLCIPLLVNVHRQWDFLITVWLNKINWKSQFLDIAELPTPKTENKTLWQIKGTLPWFHFLLLIESLPGSLMLTIATNGLAIHQVSAFLLPQEVDGKIRLLISFLKRSCHLKIEINKWICKK